MQIHVKEEEEIQGKKQHFEVCKQIFPLTIFCTDAEHITPLRQRQRQVSLFIGIQEMESHMHVVATPDPCLSSCDLRQQL